MCLSLAYVHGRHYCKKTQTNNRKISFENIASFSLGTMTEIHTAILITIEAFGFAPKRAGRNRKSETATQKAQLQQRPAEGNTHTHTQRCLILFVVFISTKQRRTMPIQTRSFRSWGWGAISHVQDWIRERCDLIAWLLSAAVDMNTKIFRLFFIRHVQEFLNTDTSVHVTVIFLHLSKI